MKGGLEQISKRKRAYAKPGMFPHPKKWIRFLDRFLLVVAVIGPLSALPQIFKIYFLKSAGDISLITWSFWAAGNLPWILYGIVHKEKPIIIAYSLWFITNMIIIIGVLIYS
jgi:uncharacterized protein with PQ loop repeat